MLKKLHDDRRDELKDLGDCLFPDGDVPEVFSLVESVKKLRDEMLANHEMAQAIASDREQLLAERDDLQRRLQECDHVTTLPGSCGQGFFAKEQVSFGVENRDSVVLDLALDVIAGRVQGLTADRLQQLR